MMADGPATLFVVGTPIGNLSDLSPRAIEVLGAADVIACEDTRRVATLLRHAGIARPRVVVVNDHTERDAAAGLVRDLVGGRRVALVSDAGMPAVSDPGHVLIRAAIDAGARVEVVPGPSAALAALVASGLASDRFCFEGFVPRRGRARDERLDAIAAEPRTTIVFEAPHRVARTLEDLERRAGASRPVVVARELTKLHEEVWRTTLGDAAEVAAGFESRGEHVIVLAGAPSESLDDATIGAALSDAVAAGATRRDAVDAVAADLGVARNRVYDVMLRLKG